MKRILTVVFVILSVVGYSQVRMIELKDEANKIELNNFYVSDVIDGRQANESIGVVQVGMFNKKVNADLAGGVENSILQYLNNSFSYDTTGTPVVVKIVHLNISEKTRLIETGRAEVKLEFYKEMHGMLGKLYESEAFVEEPGSDVTLGHEKRIRSVIKTCVNSFNASEWESVTPGYEEKEFVIGERSVVSETSFADDAGKTVNYNSLLTYSRTAGMNATGWGLTYYGYTIQDNSTWVMPWMISIESFSIRQGYFDRLNYREAALSYYMPGMCFMNNLGKNIYARFTFLVPIGSETLTSFGGQETTNFLIGLAPSQGIYFIPKSKVGLTFGVGVYERLLTSVVYPSDLGFMFEVGLKF